MAVAIGGAMLALGGCCHHGGDIQGSGPVVIDVHAHLFNAKYVPVCQIAVARGVPPGISRIIEKLVWGLCDESSPTSAGALSLSDDRLKAAAQRLLAKNALVLGAIRASFENDVLRKRPIGEILSAEEQAQLRAYLAARRGVSATSQGFDLVAELRHFFEEVRLLSDAHGPKEAAPDPSGLLRLVETMLLSEDVIAEDYHETYPDVDLVVDHLLDLDKSYGETPRFNFPTQVSRMVAMEGRGPIAKLTFGMFDPFRGDAEGLADVKNYWAEGVAGFKFYPPTGVRPAENVIPPRDMKGTIDSQWDSRYGGITAKTLDDRCEAFFSYCEANDIPILLHCSPGGFESVPGYGSMMADPKYWEAVLAPGRHPSLRVCFAHSGGSEGWYADFGNSADASNEFRTEILALCAAHPNVYCDFAYLEDMLEAGGVATMQARLRDILGASPGLSKKILYGTDWHMLTQEKGYESYLKLWREVWADSSLVRYRGDFFAGNAARYLRLSALATDPRLATGVRAQLAALNRRLALQDSTPAMQ